MWKGAYAGAPYDYESLMHYGPKSFGRRAGSDRATVIATKDPSVHTRGLRLTRKA